MQANGSGPGSDFGDSSAVSGELVRQELERVLASEHFRNSRRRSDLLRFLVERHLRGESESIKEYQVGVEAFGRPEDWDPRVDPVVRVQFMRVRQKLEEYYASEGAGDEVLIDFSQRGYLPVFTRRSGAVTAQNSAAISEPGEPALARSPVEAAPRQRSRWRVWVLAACGVAAASAIGVFAAREMLGGRGGAPVIAVLPFAEVSGQAKEGSFSDGFTDELASQLSGVNGLSVVARASTLEFKGKAENLREIGRALNAGYVVEGSIDRGVDQTGDRLRINASLEDSASGLRLWSQIYTTSLPEIFKVEGEMARAIATALRVKTSEPSTALLDQYKPKPEAYDLFMKGTYALDTSAKDAAAALEQAVKLDPNFWRAHMALSQAYANLALGSAVLEYTRKSRDAMARAVALNPAAQGGLTRLAKLNYVLDWDWPKAQREYLRGLEIAPGASALISYAWALMTRGQFEQAWEYARQGLLRDPLNAGLEYDYTFIMIKVGRFAEADEQIARLVSRFPESGSVYLYEALSDLYNRTPRETIEAANKALTLLPGSGQGLMAKALAYAQMQDRGRALEILDQPEKRGDPGVPEVSFAAVHAILGDTDRVFPYLERAAEQREIQVLYWKIEPFFAGLQKDPRMVNLEKRVGL